MHRFVRHFCHFSGIADNYLMPRLHVITFEFPNPLKIDVLHSSEFIKSQVATLSKVQFYRPSGSCTFANMTDVFWIVNLLLIEDAVIPQATGFFVGFPQVTPWTKNMSPLRSIIKTILNPCFIFDIVST